MCDPDLTSKTQREVYSHAFVKKEFVHVPLFLLLGIIVKHDGWCDGSHPVSMRRNSTVTLRRAKKKDGRKFRSLLTLFPTAPSLELPTSGFHVK